MRNLYNLFPHKVGLIFPLDRGQRFLLGEQQDKWFDYVEK